MLLTIITPTYNRVDTLPRLVESLKSQTCLDFEWVVIDDGSSDGTGKFFENVGVPFKFSYVYKQNGGKHTALNYSHRFISGDLVCIVDSDDWLSPDAVETILSDWVSHAVGNLQIGQLSYLRKDITHRYADLQFPAGYYLSDHITYRINQGIKNDCFEVTRTDLFKSLSFPEFDGERHMGEAWLWVNFAESGWRTIYINNEIYLSEYLPDGLTKAGKKILLLSPKGAQEHARVLLNKKICMKRRVKEALNYTCYGHINGESAASLAKRCESPLLSLLAYPFGTILSVAWKRKYL